MGTGYTRNDTLNNIADGNVINASDIDGEYDAIEAAFNETTGHTHDGTAAEGAPITVLGPVQDFIASATEIKPKTTNTLDIGTNSLQFKDMYLDGTAYLDDIQAVGAVDITGDLDVDNININGNTISSTDINGNITLAPNGTGVVALSSTDLTFGDNDKAIFGAGSDLQIYHNGSASVISDVGTGNFFISGDNDVFISNADISEVKAKFSTNGAVTLYYDSAAKLSTTATGVDVTGTITSDGLTVDGDATIGQTSGADRTLSIGSAGALHFDIDTVGSTGRVYLNATNDSTSGKLHLQTVGADRLFINNNGDISFYDDTGVTQGLFWDASAESLGIGITSPAAKLEVYDNSGGLSATRDLTARFYRFDGTYNPRLEIRHSTEGTHLNHTYNTVAGNFIFENGNIERMRINSSGNLLVGTTINSVNETGFRVLADGNGTKLSTTADNEIVGLFNRNTTDGSIISIRKDGTAVGSIGVAAGDNLYIGGTATNHAGVYFGTRIVYPLEAGSFSNGNVDLGHPTVARFRDLYLSGGVYLGGTGSANYLDDYEEGTWTPNFIGIGTATNNNVTAYYRKIGKVVYLTFPYTTWTSGTGSGTTDIEINNLPFTLHGTANSDVIGLQANGPTSNGLQTNFVFLTSSTRVKFYRHNATSWVRLTGQTLQSSWNFGANVFYLTND